jgi:predicted transcriptional regulator
MPGAPEKPRTVNVIVKLAESERNSLKSLALAKQRTPGFLIEESIARYTEDKEAEQAVITAAAASLDHYQQTGLHSTLDELKDWAKAVRIDHSVKMPGCHT